MDVDGAHHVRPPCDLRGVVASGHVGAKFLRVLAILGKHEHLARVVEPMRFRFDVHGYEQREREPGRSEDLPDRTSCENASSKRKHHARHWLGRTPDWQGSIYTTRCIG